MDVSRGEWSSKMGFILAAAGSGAFGSVESACDATIQVTGVTSPGENQKAYEHLYPLYRDLYPALKPTFEKVVQ